VRHVLQLLKASDDDHLPTYRQWLIHVLIRIARAADSQVPLSYFDFMSKDSGIITAGSLGQWSGSGFSFHAWLSLDSNIADSTALRQRPIYSDDDDVWEWL